MDENQKTEETIVKVKEGAMCANHPIMKAMCTGILIFLGAFCAFYVVADWHFKTIMRDFAPRKMEHAMRKEMRSMDNMWKKEMRKSGNIIHMQQTDNFYRVYIDLRAFENNENNVQVSTNGNILTIIGRSIRKAPNNEQISEFQQNYMFGDNVKLQDLTKETNGNYYIITIPIEEEKVDE